MACRQWLWYEQYFDSVPSPLGIAHVGSRGCEGEPSLIP